jgi:hypothetical protein
MKPPLFYTVLLAASLSAVNLQTAEAQSQQSREDLLRAKGYLAKPQQSRQDLLRAKGYLAQNNGQASDNASRSDLLLLQSLGVGSGQDLDSAQAALKLLESRLNAAQDELNRNKELYRTGQITQSQVSGSEAQVEQLRIQYSQAKKNAATLKNREKMQQPVDIQMDHATVQQFASALSKATGVPVEVDKSVPADASTMLTIDAQQIPFASVLEAIAQKADLMIVPNGEGVLLKKWPHLNGRVYRSPNAPWSAEWGVPPATSSLLNALGYLANNNKNRTDFYGMANGAQSNGAYRAPNKTAAGSSAQDLSDLLGANAARNQTLSGGLQGRSPAFTVTTLGDHLIAIAEPGKNAQGEAGVWLTAYKFDGSQFKKVSATFHRLGAEQRSNSLSKPTLRR